MIKIKESLCAYDTQGPSVVFFKQSWSDLFRIEH